MRKSFINSLGFTLIELIVAFSIISILSVVSVAAFVNYSRVQAVNNEAAQLIATLNTAKSKAQSQVKPDQCKTNIQSALNETLSEYRVIIDPSQFKLIAVCAAEQVDIPIEGRTNLYHEFPAPITAEVTAGSDEIVFSVLSGIVSPATITLTGEWTPEIKKTIIINTDGTIQSQ